MQVYRTDKAPQKAAVEIEQWIANGGQDAGKETSR